LGPNNQLAPICDSFLTRIQKKGHCTINKLSEGIPGFLGPWGPFHGKDNNDNHLTSPEFGLGFAEKKVCRGESRLDIRLKKRRNFPKGEGIRACAHEDELPLLLLNEFLPRTKGKARNNKQTF